MFLRKMMLAAAVAFVAGLPAMAQDDRGALPPDCEARPAPNANGNAVQPGGAVDTGQTGSLSPDKLTSCDGVLRPPATGDRMAQPPPETGTMREIRPGELPDQQSVPQQQ